MKRPFATTYHLLLHAVAGCTFIGCIEPFDATFVDFESAIVIEATITNEMKQQEIVVTRTYRFEDDGPIGESGAKVRVVSDNGTIYDFLDVGKGRYVSEVAFSAEPGMDYTLSIGTRDGGEYRSSTAQIASTSKIDSLYADRIVDDFGEEGMAIFVSTSNPGTTNNFYRYEYEETYKVIAPRWINKELEVVEDPIEPYVIVVPRPDDERVCYPTDYSKRIILTDTEDFGEGRVSNFMVRFINRDNYIITHRYSILVRQYVQSSSAYSFYETLNSFSSSESLFSETQPGFLEGNIFSVGGQNEKVLGYFDITAVDEKRIFFNYEDFFPGERLPPYADPCAESAPLNGLLDLIRWDLIKYIKDNEGEFNGPTSGPYITVPQVCGDCTILGPSEIPEFWIE